RLLLWVPTVYSGTQGSRAFWQFGNMIRCVQPGVNPFKYNNYGSYCGLRRRGTPVDEVDLCCKVHDECYAAQMRNPRCRGFFSQPYRYQYSCSGGQPTCSGKTEPGCVFENFCGENLQRCGENLTKALILKDQFTQESKMQEKIVGTHRFIHCGFQNGL
uniref:Phospholipase A2 n=1 Tax=Sparus aurata TaxID=8175 RepID=A0A671U726_SPAAU